MILLPQFMPSLKCIRMVLPAVWKLCSSSNREKRVYLHQCVWGKFRRVSCYCSEYVVGLIIIEKTGFTLFHSHQASSSFVNLEPVSRHLRSKMASYSMVTMALYCTEHQLLHVILGVIFSQYEDRLFSQQAKINMDSFLRWYNRWNSFHQQVFPHFPLSIYSSSVQGFTSLDINKTNSNQFCIWQNLTNFFQSHFPIRSEELKSDITWCICDLLDCNHQNVISHGAFVTCWIAIIRMWYHMVHLWLAGLQSSECDITWYICDLLDCNHQNVISHGAFVTCWIAILRMWYHMVHLLVDCNPQNELNLL